MISILRNGPKMIVFNSYEIEEFTQVMVSFFKGKRVQNIDEAFEVSEEDHTIILTAKPGKKRIQLSDIQSIVVVPLPSDELFSSLINIQATRFIEDSHISPGHLIMRTVGNDEKVIESVKNTYDGTILSFNESLNIGTSNQTIISFTNQSVNRKLSLKDIHEKHILIDEEVHQLQRKMRTQILSFFNEGFQDKNWYDLEIRIYDRYSQYMIHYERLLLILNALDVTLILGESWGKDHPRFLMSVMVYQVRLFTLLDPIEVKKILVGLEYLDDGTRIIDLDLIHKGNKIEWPRVINKGEKKRNRGELGKIYRKELLQKLSEEEKARLLTMEEKIIQSRY